MTPAAPERYRWRVLNPELVVRGAAVVIGVLFGVVGTGFMLAGLGVLGDGAGSFGATWISIVAGLGFIFGGLGAIVTYGIAGGARLEDDAALGIALRVRIVQFLLGLGVGISLATIVTFVALGPGRGSLAARVSCVALWVFVAVLAVSGLGRLRRRR